MLDRMNPDTGRLEPLAMRQRHVEQMRELERRLKTQHQDLTTEARSKLVRTDGSPVPDHWAIFTAGELVVVKGHTFRVAHMNECTLVLEPVKPEDVLVDSGVESSSPSL